MRSKSLLALAVIVVICALTTFILIHLGKTGPTPELVVVTKQGPVLGHLMKGGRYYSFSGIPYGTVNSSNRFKDAYPPPRWISVREPVENIYCSQGLTVTSEDCLVVNVYIPSKVENDNLYPVMINIHGGAFQVGEPMQGVENLVKHDVILVTMTYRLGVYGFLCLGTEEIPGNAGLKDQVLALRWVRDSIRAFGGNESSITLFGSDAGGMSVDLHTLSPMSENLFHQAIVQSASALAFWTVHENAIMYARKLANILGAQSFDLTELENIFLISSQTELQNAAEIFIDIERAEFFAPCIEKGMNNKEKFLPDKPINILRSRRRNTVPQIMGLNSKEGMFFLPPNLNTKKLNMVESYLSEYIPKDLDLDKADDFNKVFEQVKLFYLKNQSLDYMDSLIDFRTDTVFLWPLIVEIELLMKCSNSIVYFYEFKYNGSLNLSKIIQNKTMSKGANHFDEVGYLFDIQADYNITEITENDKTMVDAMTTLWTNFAKFGEPTPDNDDHFKVKWEPLQHSINMNYLEIDLPLSLAKDIHKRRVSFWGQIYKEASSKLFGECIK